MADGETALKIFISYARLDGAALAEDLTTGLEVAGFAPFLDRHDIAAGEDWEARLAALIQAADTVVFLVSPGSVQSPRCAWEVQTAEQLSKRVLPVLAMNVAEADTPEALRRRNYVKFTDGRSFASGLRELALALRENVGWIRDHTRLGELAARWEARSRSEALLLRGAELEAAKLWLSQWSSPAPEPTVAHRGFIGESESAEQERNSAEHQRLQAMAAAQADRTRALARARRFLYVAAGLMALLLAGTLFGGVQVRKLDRAVVLAQQEVNDERKRVVEARRNVAEFNQSVEHLRAQVDGVLLRLEGSVDPAVAAEVRTISEQVLAARANIRLSRDFTLADLTQSETVGRRALENAPDPEAFERLRHTAEILDQVKAALGGCPLVILSGYRGATLNGLLGGARSSSHTRGEGVDIQCADFGSAYAMAQAIERAPVMQEIDQLILEFGKWVHIGTGPQKRRQVLSIGRNGQRVAGLAALSADGLPAVAASASSPPPAAPN